MSDLKLYGTGRRKRSIARVFLKSGSGKIIINGKNYKDFIELIFIKFVIDDKFTFSFVITEFLKVIFSIVSSKLSPLTNPLLISPSVIVPRNLLLLSTSII